MVIREAFDSGVHRASEGLFGLTRRLGLDVKRLRRHEVPRDFDGRKVATLRRVREHTLTSSARVGALVDITRHIATNGPDGAMVEVGVWKGGSIAAVADTLLELGAATRELWLYDTFKGMTPPSSRDRDLFTNETAEDLLDRSRPDQPDSGWAVANQNFARDLLNDLGYPSALCRFVEGDVIDTITSVAPSEIALLRIDVDWYSATHHALTQLVPRVSPGGFVVLDDHARWSGARDAAEEFLATLPIEERPFLHRVDEECRVFQVRWRPCS